MVLIPLRRSRSPDDRGDGLTENLKIQRQRPMLDVFQVQLHPFFERQGTPSIDLPKTGQAGPDAESPAVPICAEFLEITNGERAGSDQTHIPFEHVDELRQFVEAGLSEEPSDGRDPRVMRYFKGRSLHLIQMLKFGLLKLCVRDHGPKLQAPKAPLIESRSFLNEEDRAEGRE